MSNLHCPNCDHLIGTLKPSATPQRSPIDARLDGQVTVWAGRQDWSTSRPSGDLFDLYRSDTGDTVTSHNRWSRSMQRVGYVKRRGAKGVRVFERG